MSRFVSAFAMMFSQVFQTAAFAGFMAVSFCVFSWAIFCKLLYILTGGVKDGD